MADVIYQVDGNPADGYRIVCEGFDVSPAVYPTLRAALTAVRTLERRDIDQPSRPASSWMPGTVAEQALNDSASRPRPGRRVRPRHRRRRRNPT